MALFHVNVSHWLKMTSRPNQANIYLFQIYNHTICFALDRKLGCILNGLIFFTSSNRCCITCFIQFESKIYRYGKQRYKWSISKIRRIDISISQTVTNEYRYNLLMFECDRGKNGLKWFLENDFFLFALFLCASFGERLFKPFQVSKGSEWC